jgi:alkaline phosphatase D
MRTTIAIALLVGCGGARPVPSSGPPIFLAPIAFGEIATDGAVAWARASRPSFLHLSLDGASDHDRSFVAEATEAADFTVRIELEGLHDRTQTFHAWLSASAAPETAPADAMTGTLSLAPPSTDAAAVTFGFGGDIGGQDVCRDAERGWPIVSEAAHAGLDFFVALGDVVYEDDICTDRGRYGNAQIAGDFPAAFSLDEFRAHYRYAEADAGFSALRARSYAVWDDHETTNDVGPEHDRRRGSEHLLPLGRRAFVEHSPVPSRWLTDASAPLYRSARWGRHLEVFMLDTRSYRDANTATDDPHAPKTMLGATQRAWLRDGLVHSDATWRVIVSSVPIGIPTAFQRGAEDSWADGGSGRGFERELGGLFGELHEAGVRNLVFITTDVHFATTIRYRPFPFDPDWTVHELVTGPMGAGMFPTDALDETFHPERLFFHAPSGGDTSLGFDEALRYFNWGRIAVSESGHLHYEVRSFGDTALYTLDLDPS